MLMLKKLKLVWNCSRIHNEKMAFRINKSHIFNRIKKEKKTNEDPKSGCKRIKSAGPKNNAMEMIMVLVVVVDNLKKLK